MRIGGDAKAALDAIPKTADRMVRPNKLRFFLNRLQVGFLGAVYAFLVDVHYPLQAQRKPKEGILNLAKYMEKKIRIRFQGGREGKQNICSVQRISTRTRQLMLTSVL